AFIINFAVEVLALPLVLGHVHEPVVHETHHHSVKESWRHLFSLPLAAIYLAYMCMQMVMGTLGALWAIWVHDLGGSFTFIGVTFSAFALPQILFGASAGRLADQWGRARILLLTGLIAATIYASYGFLTNLVAITALGILEGLAIVFQTPVLLGMLADASPVRARGRVQGISGAMGAIGGSAAAFASLPLYHANRPEPFVLTGGVMVVGSAIAAFAAVALVKARRARALAEVAVSSA
ncbi:MAG: MFS transporter, partial [Chloroflexota bacterium]